MNVLFIDGVPASEKSAIRDYIPKLIKEISSHHNAAVLCLADLKLTRCTGCFGCWVKTPGRCVSADDSRRICDAYIQADSVVYASPLIRGFTSALLKSAQDKLIPLIHPYFQRVAGEVHHMPRYDTYPRTALLLERAADTDEEDIEIVTEIYHRNARNFQTRFNGCAFTNMDVSEAARVIAAH